MIVSFITRVISATGSKWFAKDIEIPFAPFIGMHLDDQKVESVKVYSDKGWVACELESSEVGSRRCDWRSMEDAESTYLSSGWRLYRKTTP
jgi:hypothetical protein